MGLAGVSRTSGRGVCIICWLGGLCFSRLLDQWHRMNADFDLRQMSRCGDFGFPAFCETKRRSASYASGFSP